MTDEHGAASEPLTQAEQDLACIAEQGAQDAFLVELARLGYDGLGLNVGLLMNGMIVLGRLGRPEDVAEVLDAQRRDIAKLASTSDDDDGDDWVVEAERSAGWGRRSEADVEALREADALLESEVEEFGGRGGVDVSEVPARLGRAVISADSRAHLTLVDVRCYAPAQAGVLEVPVMRVQVVQVAGWWLVPVDETGRGTFQAWGPSEE